jgi:hypothetical protein
VQIGTENGKEVEVFSGLNAVDDVVVDPRALKGSTVPVEVKQRRNSARIPKLPPGTLLPIELPFDPTATLPPLCLEPSSPQAAQAGGQKGGSSKDADLALKKALVAEARKTYEQNAMRLRNLQNIPPEHLYRWSRRWLEAQLALAETKEERVASLQSHLERMNNLAGITGALAATGQARPADSSAGRFYRIQSEFFLDGPE